MLEPGVFVPRGSAAGVAQHVVGSEHRLHDARQPGSASGHAHEQVAASVVARHLGLVRLVRQRAFALHVRVVRPGPVAESAAAAAAADALGEAFRDARVVLTRRAGSRMVVANGAA